MQPVENPRKHDLSGEEAGCHRHDIGDGQRQDKRASQQGYERLRLLRERSPDATGLTGYLRQRGFSRVFIAGLAFDFCVRWSG